ncbi:transcription factor, STE-like protein, partial [Conidiobolus coronatus NRRL 28638]
LSMSKLNQLLCFLNTASKTWDGTNNILKFPLDNGKSVSCIYWKGDYFITGTDIIRCLVYRFQAAGYYVIHQKKFEEGVFSDLRNLKPGLDAVLEPAHSELLRFLHRHQCIRTQKKQKIFFWNAVPHDRL